MTLADAQHPPAGPRGGRHAAAARDLAHLHRLIGVMHRHTSHELADERELALLAGAVSASTAEQHLRAIGALLATLDTYVRCRRRHDEPAHTPASEGDAARVSAPPTAPDTVLAAAAARYIARDLAARRLSEFTSAEGYRLARWLARIGDVEAPVERLLAEASTIRLHPAPLTDAVSHSAG
ncbi:MAG TPA: hypothetical protein VK923_02970 [Euzebyales bacterium]|nr:hypothetical protein [Euzebyales bacterium]